MAEEKKCCDSCIQSPTDYEYKYKTALEIARASSVSGFIRADVVFPELKESRDDRMLREIRRYIKEQGDKPTGLPNGQFSVSDMIEWIDQRHLKKRCSDSANSEGEQMRNRVVAILRKGGEEYIEELCWLGKLGAFKLRESDAEVFFALQGIMTDIVEAKEGLNLDEFRGVKTETIKEWLKFTFDRLASL